MSIRPWRAIASATAASIDASSVTSPPTMPGAACRSTPTTVAPSSAKRATVAAPRPDAAPVISATFPARRSAKCEAALDSAGHEVRAGVGDRLRRVPAIGLEPAVGPDDGREHAVGEDARVHRRVGLSLVLGLRDQVAQEAVVAPAPGDHGLPALLGQAIELVVVDRDALEVVEVMHDDA